MSTFRERWKPSADIRTQLTAAAGLWTVVGLGLGTAGVLWALASRDLLHVGFVALGLGIGLAKAWFVIRPMAARNAERIVSRGDGRCLGSFLSWKSWLFVFGMMGMGYVLRHSPLPRPALGVLYVAIGTALLLGATPIWQALRRQ